MNNIQIFNNPQFGQIRVAQTDNGEPIFCLVDICSILDLQTSRVKSRLPEDGVTISKVIDNLVRTQEASFINEKNLYKCIFQSRKETAEVFTDYVAGEVLPSIRKHGAYMTGDVLEQTLNNPDFLIQLATTLKQERAERVRLNTDITEQAPKVLFAQAVETSQKSCLVGELAKVLKQNGIEIGQNRLFEWLRQSNYLCSKGEACNQPTQKAMELGLFEIKKTTINKPDGSILVSTAVKVTGKGQIYFVDKFLNKQP